MAKLIVKDGRLCIVGGRLVTDADGAPCVCGEPVDGVVCYAQMTPCSCPSAGEVYYIRVPFLYRDGRIWPVYKIAGVCYQVLGTLATDNRPSEWLGVPGFESPDDIEAWYASCAASACIDPSCPCGPGTELISIVRSGCTPQQFSEVCARYVLIQIEHRGQAIQTDIIRRAGCPTIRPVITRNVTASGYILFDFLTNTAVDASISVSAQGTASRLIGGNPCFSIDGTATYDRTLTYDENSTIGIGFPVWITYTGQSFLTGNIIQVQVNTGGPTQIRPNDLSPDESLAFPEDAVGVDGVTGTCTAFSGTFSGTNGYTSNWAYGYTAGGYSSNASYSYNNTNGSGSGTVSMFQSWRFYNERPTTPPGENLCGRYLWFQACDGSGDRRAVDTLLAGYSYGSGMDVAVFTENGQPRCYSRTADSADSGDVPVQFVPNCQTAPCASLGVTTPGDAYLDSIGFDPEEEERRIRAGGCCGQPSA